MVEEILKIKSVSNSYFQFKQFTIHQDQCAMKVSTEACILGAWANANQPKRILDIGTGTGLLALMLAQKYDSDIDAVEIDHETARQAKENIAKSPWSTRIQVIQQDITAFAESTDQKYDLIVCNPPFFQASQQSENFKENLAKHETEFFVKKKLAHALLQLLASEGAAFVLYPPEECAKFEKEIEKVGLNFQPSLIVKNQANKSPFRVISKITRIEQQDSTEELIIRDGNEYSGTLKSLMQPYYLKF